MNTPVLQRFFSTACILFILSIPQTAAALDLVVDRNSSNPARYATIQAALDYARNQLTESLPGSITYRVVVTADPYPYSEPFTPISNVPIIGSETGGTFLSGHGSGTLISLNNVSNVTIKNFTFDSAAVGIVVTNSSSVTIANNIFKAGAGRVALQIQESPTTRIVNNTFYQNGTALSTNVDNLITNNIFASNGTAIATTTKLTKLTYNTYHNNGTNGAITLDPQSLPNSSATNPGPLFVDPDINDFHLQISSPCHMYDGVNAGNPDYPNADNPAFFDMGAYGGPGSDTIPFGISGLKSTNGATANSVALNWNLNMSYQVSGYHVYYGTATDNHGGSGAAEGNSPLTIPQGVNSAILSNLPLAPLITPAAVTNVTVIPQYAGFMASWTPVASATGYKVYYSSTAFTAASLPTTFQRFDGAKISGIYVYGLTVGVTYYVAVTAITQPGYFLTVTAFNSAGGAPGVSNESNYAPEVIHYLGPIQESTPSNVATVVPTSPTGGVGSLGDWGGLPGPGCFIATAAYGYYSAPQVQVLRDFRDNFLLTNAPGRAFVAWYYRYGPKGAEFINTHPWSKPLVRLLLLPLIGGSLFILHASLMAECVVLAVLLLLSCTIVRRRKTEKGGIP
ncbi:MAG: right-handed parallel beta-helix repeat-containing protein [Desulfuromonadaceae bacterium]